VPLIRGTRRDVAAKEKGDRSGLAALDWAVIAVDNAFRQAHFAMADAEERDRKLKRLDALLDDPALAETHDPSHPDRLDAIARHFELHGERHRYRTEARRAAIDVDRLWGKVPDTEARTWIRDGLALVFADSPIWPVALADVTLCRLRFWQEGGETWRNREAVEMPPCPF
jgi:hypothetical protein